jgi:hypothetical protein
MAKVTNVFGKTPGRLRKDLGKTLGSMSQACGAKVCGGLEKAVQGMRLMGKRFRETEGSESGAKDCGIFGKPEVTSQFFPGKRNSMK